MDRVKCRLDVVNAPALIALLICMATLTVLGAPLDLGLSGEERAALSLHPALVIVLLGLIYLPWLADTNSLWPIRSGLQIGLLFTNIRSLAGVAFLFDYPMAAQPFQIAMACCSVLTLPLAAAGPTSTDSSVEYDSAKRLRTTFAFLPVTLLLVGLVAHTAFEMSDLTRDVLIYDRAPEWSALLPGWSDVEYAASMWRVLVALVLFFGILVVLRGRSDRRYPKSGERQLTAAETAFVDEASPRVEAHLLSHVPVWYRAMFWVGRLLYLATVPIFIAVTHTVFIPFDERNGEDISEFWLDFGVPNQFLIGLAWPLLVRSLFHLATYVWPSFREYEFRRVGPWSLSDSERTKLSRSIVENQVRYGTVDLQRTYPPSYFLEKAYRVGERTMFVATIIVTALIFVPIDLGAHIMDGLRFLMPVQPID
jgi:hypothetical protein